MLDSDLAAIYGYSTKDFNRQVKNNREKFAEDFMFQLTKEEADVILRCKNFTSSLVEKDSRSGYGGRRYCPYAFTEQGIYMLMTVLRGELATKQSIALIRLFKGMKDFILENQPLLGQREYHSAARKSVIVYDNYISLKTLVLMKNISAEVSVTVVTDNVQGKLSKAELIGFRTGYISSAD